MLEAGNLMLGGLVRCRICCEMQLKAGETFNGHPLCVDCIAIIKNKACRMQAVQEKKSDA